MNIDSQSRQLFIIICVSYKIRVTREDPAPVHAKEKAMSQTNS